MNKYLECNYREADNMTQRVRKFAAQSDDEMDLSYKNLIYFQKLKNVYHLALSIIHDTQMACCMSIYLKWKTLLKIHLTRVVSWEKR